MNPPENEEKRTSLKGPLTRRLRFIADGFAISLLLACAFLAYLFLIGMAEEAWDLFPIVFFLLSVACVILLALNWPPKKAPKTAALSRGGRIKRWLYRAYFILFLPSLFAYILISGGIYITWAQDAYLYLPFVLHGIFLLFSLHLPPLLFAAVFMFIQKHFGKLLLSLLCAITVLLCTILPVMINMVVIIFRQPQATLVITSPDGLHEIVINADIPSFDSDWVYGDIYEKNSPFTMKRIGGYSIHSNTDPIANGNYSIEWSESGLVIYYDYDGDGVKDEESTFKFLS